MRTGYPQQGTWHEDWRRSVHPRGAGVVINIRLRIAERPLSIEKPRNNFTSVFVGHTIKNRRVLSLFYLGIQVISRAEHDQFSMHLLFGVLHQISVSITVV